MSAEPVSPLDSASNIQVVLMTPGNQREVNEAQRTTVSTSEPMGVLLCGDVMTGRGVDQILPNRGNPVLYEPVIRDAREYIWLAEQVNGPIARPVDFAYIWGDAMQELLRPPADVRIINLETSVTTSEDAWPGKGINYRMHPGNINCLTEASIDCCCLANNHILDWGYTGLTETLRTLDKASLAHAGAGENDVEAAAPAVIDVPGKGRVLVFSLGSISSGIPWKWAATETHAGINLLDGLSKESASNIADLIEASRVPGDVIVVSIHWGPNWGYHVPDEQIDFAHRLVEAGVDIVHGHSSHHIKTLEIYRNRLIIYGCGDFVDDYEGIGGHEAYRGDLRAIYRVQIDPRLGQLVKLQVIPLQVRRFQLHRASEEDTTWLCDLLSRLGSSSGTHAEQSSDNSITVSRK